MESLVAAAASLGIQLDAPQQAQFRRYYGLLEAGGETASLTGAHGWERVRDELFVRSLRILAAAPGNRGAGAYGQRSIAGWFEQNHTVPGVPAEGQGVGRSPSRQVLDVGTGAGIPGLVLKIAVPAMDLTLLDSNHRKCEFLRLAAHELGLKRVSVIEGRAEVEGHSPALRETFDLVVSRGVARLAELAELTLPFARVGGVVLSAKGPDADEEVAEAAYAAETLGAAPAVTQVISSPGSAAPDTMVYWFKLSPAPERYPRRTGIPHKRPLSANERS